MKVTLKSPNTQEGTSSAGESLSVSTVASATADTLSPHVSGGATKRVVRSLEEKKNNEQDQAIFAVPRSVDQSEDEDNASICSAVSLMSASSADSIAVRARKRGRRSGKTDDVETPTAKRKLRSSTRARDEGDSDTSLLTKSTTRAKESLPSLDELASEMKAQPTADLGACIAESLEAVEKVAERSKSLKGNFVHTLRIATRTVKVAADVIALRALGYGSEKLEAENAALRSRLSNMEESLKSVTRDLEDLRRQNQSGAAQRTVPVAPQTTIISIEEIGILLDQRLAAFRAELFPDRAIRPPFLGRTPAANSPVVNCTAESTTIGAKQNRKKNPRNKENTVNVLHSDNEHRCDQSVSEGLLTSIPSMEVRVDQNQNQTQTWSQVAGRNKRMRQHVGSSRVVPAVQRNPGGLPKTETKPPRIPKTAAITVTVPVGSNTTYSAVMAAVKQRVKLADIGVTNIRQKRAATGGIIIEVPGTDADPKADKLADVMRNALSDFTDVRIARPMKTGEMRVMDLDESITQEDIAVAVAEAGGCLVADVKVGHIRLPSHRLGTAWVKCPIVALSKIATIPTGRIVIGAWHSARVKILKARPLQCYKCLRTGHVKAQCPSEEDRSGRCYACGQPGHAARACLETTFTCPVCSDYGIPADHRLGSKKCNPPKTKRNRVNQGPSTTTTACVSHKHQDTESPEEAMEAQNSIS